MLKFFVALLLLAAAAFAVFRVFKTDDSPGPQGQEVTAPADTAPDGAGRRSEPENPVAIEDEGAARREVARPDAVSLPSGDLTGAAVTELTAGTGGISGRVVDTKGSPVVDATVTLFVGAEPGLPFMNNRTNTGRTSQTDSDGTYHLPDLPARADYAVVAVHAAHAQAEAAAVAVRDDDMTLVPDIVLGDGVKVLGTVTDARTAPVAEATVYLYDPLASTLGRTKKPWKTTTTDAVGNYEFTNVHFNGIEVEVEAKGFARVSRQPAISFETGVLERRLDFTLSEAKSIAGVVVDGGGQPVVDARIQAFQMAGNPELGICRATATTSDDGRFALADVADGEYHITAQATNYSDSRNVQAAAGDRDVRIVMESQGRIAGKVKDARSGAPVTEYRLRVKIETKDGTFVPRRNHADVKSADGSYVFAGLDPGTYVMEASAANYAPGVSAPVFVNRDGLAEGVDILLDEGGTITGIVSSADGPVVGASIKLNENKFVDHALLRFLGRPDQGAAEKSTKTDSRGAFTLSYLGAGTFQVAVSKEGFAPLAVNDIEVVGRQTQDLGTLRLLRGAVITGQCLDAAGRPFSQGQVSCANVATGEQKSATPDLDGRFEFTNLPEGEYALTVRPERLEGQPVNPFQLIFLTQKTEKKILLRDGTNEKVTLSLPPPNQN